jgi:riboflavin kinase
MFQGTLKIIEIFLTYCDEKLKVDIKAKVFSGLGEGEFFVNLYAKNIRKALGFSPFPGTLNLKVEEPYVSALTAALNKADPVIIDPPLVPGMTLGRVLAYPALLNYTVKVFIVRPEITVYKSDVIELVAEIKLRDLLNLTDGSEVTVTIEVPG